MYLSEVKELLSQSKVPYREVTYKTESEFYRHISRFPNLRRVQGFAVTTLVIQSRNGKCDIELEFDHTRDGFVFEEMYFGEYAFGFFELRKPDALSREIMSAIKKIVRGEYKFIVCNNLTRKTLDSDGCFDVKDDPEPFRRALTGIKKRPGPIGRIFGYRLLYEIYDWQSFRSIIRK